MQCENHRVSENPNIGSKFHPESVTEEECLKMESNRDDSVPWRHAHSQQKDLILAYLQTSILTYLLSLNP